MGLIKTIKIATGRLLSAQDMVRAGRGSPTIPVTVTPTGKGNKETYLFTHNDNIIRRDARNKLTESRGNLSDPERVHIGKDTYFTDTRMYNSEGLLFLRKIDDDKRGTEVELQYDPPGSFRWSKKTITRSPGF
jgi:hypothetical protein